MERIRLSKEEKEVLRFLKNNCGCPDTYPRPLFEACVDSLEIKGLVKAAWTEGHKLEDARITTKGLIYVPLNTNPCNPPSCNPINWKRTISIIIATIGTAIGLISLFVSCTMLP